MTDKPVTHEPVTDEPATDEPVTDEPVTVSLYPGMTIPNMSKDHGDWWCRYFLALLTIQVEGNLV